jgi:U32 family peptidase
VNQKNSRTELLAPAGNFEKLEIAVHFGADAVYLANKEFSLRNYSGNFTIDEMSKAVNFAHQHDVKVYVACNIYSRNFEQDAIHNYLGQLGDIRPDAIIVADPGIIQAARKIVPEISIHLSTQANTTNFQTVLFWESLGIKRVNVARELSLQEIKEISRQCSAEIEAFVHGAMCISYSGRCLLSTFLSKRDSNRGMCTHPCRWNYAVVEELRPGEYMPFAEDDRGSYIFNSKDLCMIEHIPDMIHAGIDSLKIEGRMKGINYLASTVKVYREAIDLFFEDPKGYILKKEWMEELSYVNNRCYSSGFYFGDPDQVSPNFVNCKPLAGHRFVGKIIKSTERHSSLTTVEVRNKIFKAENVEILKKTGPLVNDQIKNIIDTDGKSVDFAQPGSVVTIEMANAYSANDLIRRIGEDA